jgi:hypothetical protein
MTLTDDNAMAEAATAGESMSPKNAAKAAMVEHFESSTHSTHYVGASVPRNLGPGLDTPQS